MRIIFIIITFCMSAGFALANDTIVARVNGVDVTKADIRETAKQLMGNNFVEDVLTPGGEVYSKILDVVLQRRIITQNAIEQGVDKLAHVQSEIATVSEMVIADAFISQLVDRDITDAILQAEYNKLISQNSGEEEIQANHILLETEQEARSVIALIEQGGDFATLAKEYSTGPSGPNGGDLGYFARGAMVAPFEEAAFSLNKGEYTLDPVQTQFGWHVILVGDKRQLAPIPFEQAKDGLKQELAQGLVQQILREFATTAVVEIADENGNLEKWQQ